MAQLDRIILKHSVEESQADFVTALQNGDIEGGDIEPGEVVLRRGENFVEMWTLDAFDNPKQISVDIGGVTVPWNVSELAAARLSDLGDVDTTDGTGGLGVSNAGWNLTWDGLKWVVRPPASYGGDAGLIPSLNDVGDVNYAFYASESNPKYTPDQNDILWYQFDYNAQKYYWAPTALSIDKLEFIDAFSGVINLQSNKWNRIQFGLVGRPISECPAVEAGGNSIQLAINGNNIRAEGSSQNAQFKYGRITLQARDEIRIEQGGGAFAPILKYNTDFPPDIFVDGGIELAFTTLADVRQEFTHQSIFNLADVTSAGIQTGYVLAWNTVTSQFEPSAGPAPDLTAASINELQDVNTSERGHGTSLIWIPTEGQWRAVKPDLWHAKWDYYDFFGGNPQEFPTDRCQPCNEDNLGRVTVVGNLPYVCLKSRQFPQQTNNNKYSYIQILLNGYDKTINDFFPPEEYRQETQFKERTDPLHPVAYEGSIGSLSNVSTADAFPGAALVYTIGGQPGFAVGYPALNLEAYSVGELGNVDDSGAGEGYGLLWDGSNWKASTLDQRFRLDDMVDVAFGDLGVTNNKLVAAYMLVQNPNLPYVQGEDLSTVLAVSTVKTTANMGTTYEWYSPDAKFYPVARYFGPNSNWTIQQKLDNYVWWENEPSWQKIDGDGCIEIWFYCTLLLQDRCIFSKSGQQGQGSYRLRLKQNGSLEWFVNGPQGQSGFTITTGQNSVSLNNWHHVAVVKEANNHRLYLDGFKVGQAQANVIYTGNQRFALGRNDLDDSNPLTHNFWRGYLLDLRVTRGRPKYTGDTYTVPFAIGAEIKDTTPNAGDFLSYDGSKWTNVTGVSADISAKSITELADVDTTTYNPGTGDALVWTGTKWEPGIPGIGSTWALDDFTDVSTSYGGFFPYLRLDQATTLRFSPLYKVEEDDAGLWAPGYQVQMFQYDNSWTCDDETFPGADQDATFYNSQTTYILAGLKGQMSMKGEKITIQNVFVDCNFIPYRYHKAVLFYDDVPDRGDSDNPTGDIPGNVDPKYIPCWGVIEDHFGELLPFGVLGQLGNVSSASPTLGQALAWNGSQWAPSSSVAADISNNGIGDLADVADNATGGSITTGHALVWNGGQWAPAPVLQDIFSFNDIETITITDNAPIGKANIYGQLPQTLPTGTNANKILGFGKDGARGISFKTGESVNIRNAYVYGGAGPHFPTVITSGILGSSGSFLEVGSTLIRVSDNGANSNGTGGFALAKGWIFKYEDPDLVWSSFSDSQIPNKESITEALEYGLANLDLTPYPLEDLSNIDTTGKALGYALVWNGVDKWIASDSVAANISQSSIGGLKDVTKTANSSASTNDGSLLFDIGALLTARPSKSGGGLELLSTNNSGVIGWDPSHAGAPYLKTELGEIDESWLSVRGDEITASAVNGIRYDRQPSLGDSTIPSWLQVKQQIIRSAVDYQSLFYLGGDSLQETSYNWPLQIGISTAPNPVYESRFEGHYSLQFRKVNQDKIEWLTEDGCPETFAAQQVWSIEFLIKVDSSTSGDGFDEYILSPVSPAGNSSNGLHVYLKGSDRKKLGVFFGSKSVSSVSSGNHLEGFLVYDQWCHVYMAQEGGGNIVLYIQGVQVDTHLQTGSWGLPGGLAIGGRSQGVAFDEQTYLTAQLDDLRITDRWLPYAAGLGSVPVPVEPIALSDAASVFGRLSMLEDVNTVTTVPVHGDALIWDALQGVWKPGAAPAADISAASIDELTDVNTFSSVPDQDDILGWDSIQGEWKRTKIDGNGGIRALVARSVVPGQVPTAGSLYAGELYLNMADKKLYALDSSGTAFTFATDGTYSDVTEIDGGTY